MYSIFTHYRFCPRETLKVQGFKKKLVNDITI